MAERVSVLMVDDLTGQLIPDGEGDTVSFGLDGIEYEIDLPDSSANKLRALLIGYAQHARRTSPSPSQAHTNATQYRKRDQNQAVRAWANENGWEIGENGRIPSHVWRDYFENHMID